MHPKALIDDLLRETRERAHKAGQVALAPGLVAASRGSILKGILKTCLKI